MKFYVVFGFAFALLVGCGKPAPPTGTAESRRSLQRQESKSEPATPPNVAKQLSKPKQDQVDQSARNVVDAPPGKGTSNAAAVFRRDDDRPNHDEVALANAGIRRISSKHLILYTDLPLEKVRGLPQFVDALYPEWQAYFGDLPPARDGTDYQLTGYVIGEEQLFSDLRLVPTDLPYFEHGLHRGRQFWIRDQAYDYYRTHLLLHEATHCYMTDLPGSIGPVWYMEGMAEYFAAHRNDDVDTPEFQVMPQSPQEAAGFDRISVIRKENLAGDYRSLEDVISIHAAEFVDKSPYAWSWAACYFLDNHPRYKERFRQLADPRIRSRFGTEFQKAFAGDWPLLQMEWGLFAQTLRYGYEIEAAISRFEKAKGEIGSAPSYAKIAANQGWQSTGLRVTAGETYSIQAAGEVVLDDEPILWKSDANGISFDYAEGEPIGLLLAAVLIEPPSDSTDPAGGLLTPIPVGRDTTITVPATGILCFRVNDSWDKLSNNRNGFDVTVQLASE